MNGASFPEWRVGVAVQLPKQREWDLFKHVHPIMLLPTTGKLSSRCLLNHLKPWVGLVNDFTFVFRRFYQATDPTMCLLRQQSRRNEWRRPWNFLKTDITKAYDRLWLNALTRVMERKGGAIAPKRRPCLGGLWKGGWSSRPEASEEPRRSFWEKGCRKGSLHPRVFPS